MTAPIWRGTADAPPAAAVDLPGVAAVPDDRPPEVVAAPLVRRRRRLLAVVAGAVLLAVAGAVSPLLIKSPQQVAAEAQPPPRTVLTAAVEQRVLRDTVVLRGEVGPLQSFSVTPGTRGDGKAVVTAVKARQGDRISAGTVVLEVGARPLIVLPGTTPAYRDLKPGANGKDVAQLQAALKRLGFRSGDRAGYFGEGTKRALSRFYDSKGYAPLPVSDTDQKQVDDARRQVVAGERAVADARDAVAALAQDAHATAQQKSEAAKALTRAREDLTAAQRQRDEITRITGPMLPQGEYVFLPSFPARIDALKAVVGAEVTTPLVTFSAGSLVVKATLTEAQRVSCKPGQKVEIAGDGDLTAKGAVTSIGEQAVPPPTEGQGAAPQPSGVPVVITPSAPLDARVSGQNVRLTIETASSGGSELVVPVSAIYAGADGATYVTRRSGDGEEVQIRVEPGMSAQGFVAITVQSGRLRPGDLVTVGSA
ncbi:peptidoglycan-binding protein [Micromonospora sp. NPDC007230]|uniref:peptidoglycan-binding protein n=1 Tax=Micromonospora sp. NPDC007230 TaxID=3364237 RepID=UPI0036A3B3E7